MKKNDWLEVSLMFLFLMILYNNFILSIVGVASVFIHELGHYFAFKKYKAKILEFKVGFLNGYVRADISNLTKKQFAICIFAGPLFNLLQIPLGIILFYIFPYFGIYLSIAGFLLGIFNLIPIGPLDGGLLLKLFCESKNINEVHSLMFQAITSFIICITAIYYGDIILSVIIWLIFIQNVFLYKRKISDALAKLN